MPGPNTDKTVYVLGAGFSAGAGLPIQSNVLGNILSRLGYSFSGILASESEKVFQDSLDRKINEIQNFIERCFPHPDQSLEDIFTLLDQTIESNGHFRGLSGTELQTIRRTWIEIIVGYFHAVSMGYLQSDKSICQRFIAFLLTQKIEHGQDKDPCSVISLNWDSLLEDSLFEVIRTISADRKADIDYCVYTTPLDDSTHTPSTKQKASGLFNLKLLKIHGSTTWLRCPNSNHLYTGLGSSKNPYEIYVSPRRSPFIEQSCPDLNRNHNAPFLEPFIITPTYAKVFDQPHIQTTWHNAYVELREAAKIVFIGYSVPEADYHFRTLLRRAIRDDATIQVVLHENDAPTFDEEEEPELTEESERLPKLRHSQTYSRYQQLFGDARIKDGIRYDGMEAFVDDLLPEKTYPAVLKALEESLSRHKTYEDMKQAGIEALTTSEINARA